MLLLFTVLLWDLVQKIVQNNLFYFLVILRRELFQK